MFYEGTATNYSDLLNVIVAAAIAAGNDWEIVEDERATVGKNWVILKGVGDDAAQQIFVGIQLYQNALADTYGFILQGFAGFQAGVSFHNQAGAIPNIASNFVPHVALWNNPIDYWLCVNKRRITFVAKVSTLYLAGYLGYILPYGSVGQFPYPLVVGGSARSAIRYDLADANHTHFVIPYTATLRIRDNAGVWQPLVLPSTNSSYLAAAGTYPYCERAGSNGFDNLKETPNTGGAIYPIQSVLLLRALSADNYKGNIYGELDGIFHVGGLDNAAENIVQIGGVDYLTVQNVFRTTTGDFWALRLS